ncbi:MAG: hypothetical protein U0R80_10155 [Nocardioidaceae bacterium]
MAVHGVPHLPSIPDGSTHSSIARWSIALAGAAGVVLLAGAALLGIAWLAGGADAVEDTWVGESVVVTLSATLVASLAGFLMALTVRLRHEAWPWLRLPLLFFPTVVLLLVLGELFVWE